VFKELLGKRSRVYTLPMAPANNSHFLEMKYEIENLERIKVIQRQNEAQNKKSYFETH
jgi:hypothetical protein